MGKPLLQLALFGHMQALCAAGQNVLPRSRKTRAVLAVLALSAPRPVLRARLTSLLWSRRGREQARASLRQAVHELQRALGPQISELLVADRSQLRLLADQVWVDARALADASTAAPDGLRLFRPAFLEDLAGLDPAFDAWIAEEHQRLTQLARALAEDLLTAARDSLSRMQAAEDLLAIDRTHEGAWQSLIRGYLQQNDRDAARGAFRQYSAALASAGLRPDPAVEALLQRRVALTQPATTSARDVRLAVLQPRSLDADQSDRFLCGLSQEISAAISRFRWLSCFAGSQRARESDWMHQDVDAEYVLDSTFQRSGTKARIILRLLDVRAGCYVVWAKRFDRQVDDWLTLQSDIAAETAAQIDPELLLREGEYWAAGREGKSARDLTLRAIPSIYRLESSSFRHAGQLLAAAISVEPGFAAAYAWWAYWHLFLVGQAWADDPAAATARAGELADRAVTLDPGDARALTLVGHVRSFLHKRSEEACVLHERALALNPNLPLAWCFFGLSNSYRGRHDEAIQQIGHAHTLSPHDPHAFFFDMALMMPYYLRGDFNEALALGRRAIQLNPGFSSTYKGYLATLGQLQHHEEAARARARLLALEPQFTVRAAIERSPMTRVEDLKLYAEGLRRAGLPEG